MTIVLHNFACVHPNAPTPTPIKPDVLLVSIFMVTAIDH